MSGAVGAVAAEVTSSLCVVGRASGDELCRRGARVPSVGSREGTSVVGDGEGVAWLSDAMCSSVDFVGSVSRTVSHRVL